jgi:vWA-MoxR associated protein C-terminal domain
MSKDRRRLRLEQELADVERQYELWHKKLNILSDARIIETDPATIFKLDCQIAEAQAEIDRLNLKIKLLEEQLSSIFQFLAPGNDFTNPAPVSLSDLDFADISEDIIQQAYQDSLPPDAGVWGLTGNNISQKIHTLEQFGRLPDFFDRLIQDENVSLAVRDRLQSIAKQLALKKSPETTKNRASPNSDVDRAKQLRSYLIATLTPDDIDRDRYLLNAWLIEDDSNQDILKFESLLDPDEKQLGKICKFTQISTQLERFIEKALDKLIGKKYCLTIEIFLPSNLMCMEIDRWEINDPISGKITLGTEYPIRLRSIERLDVPYLLKYLSAWYQSWDNVRVVLENGSIQDIFEHLEEVESFNWKLLKIRLKEKIGLKVTCTHPKSMRKDLFRAILQATTPVAIWIRNDIPDLDRVMAIDRILTFKPLRHLCESVRHAREIADAQTEEHLGLHLAVIWENPYRLTPDLMELLEPRRYKKLEV